MMTFETFKKNALGNNPNWTEKELRDGYNKFVIEYKFVETFDINKNKNLNREV